MTSILGGGKSSGSSGTQVVQNNTTPWEGQQRYLTDIYGKAQEAYNQTPKGAYQGPVLAAVLPEQQAAQQAALQKASGWAGQAGFDLPMANAIATARGDFLSPTSNPYLRSAVDAAIEPMVQNYQARVVPQIRDSALSSGYYGGSRHGVADALAVRDLNRQIADTSATMYANNYQTERQNQLNAPALIQDATTAALLPMDLQTAAAGNLQAIQQQGIDVQLAKQTYDQQQPFVNLANYQSLITGGGNFSNRTETSSATGGNRLGSAIQGGLAGGAGGAQLAKSFLSSANPWNLATYGAGGAALGILGGLLS